MKRFNSAMSGCDQDCYDFMDWTKSKDAMIEYQSFRKADIIRWLRDEEQSSVYLFAQGKTNEVNTESTIQPNSKMAASDANKKKKQFRETTLLNIMGVLIELLNEKRMNDDAIKQHITDKYKAIRGLGPRNLDDYFASANKSIKDAAKQI